MIIYQYRKFSSKRWLFRQINKYKKFKSLILIFPFKNFWNGKKYLGLTLQIGLCTMYFRIHKKCCRDTYLINFLYKLYLLIPFYSKFILKTQNCAHFVMLMMKRLNFYFLIVLWNWYFLSWGFSMTVLNTIFTILNFTKNNFCLDLKKKV